MHSELGTLSSGLPHSETTGSQPGCRLPCAFRRLQRPSSPLDAKTSVVRPCSITPTGRRNSLRLATQLTSRPAGFSSSRHMFGTNQLPQPSCDDWFPPTTQPFLRATYSSSYHDGLRHRDSLPFAASSWRLPASTSHWEACFAEPAALSGYPLSTPIPGGDMSSVSGCQRSGLAAPLRAHLAVPCVSTLRKKLGGEDTRFRSVRVKPVDPSIFITFVPKSLNRF